MIYPINCKEFYNSKRMTMKYKCVMLFTACHLIRNFKLHKLIKKKNQIFGKLKYNNRKMCVSLPFIYVVLSIKNEFKNCCTTF